MKFIHVVKDFSYILKVLIDIYLKITTLLGRKNKARFKYWEIESNPESSNYIRHRERKVKCKKIRLIK